MKCDCEKLIARGDEIIATIEEVQLVEMYPPTAKEDEAEIYLLIKHILENG